MFRRVKKPSNDLDILISVVIDFGILDRTLRTRELHYEVSTRACRVSTLAFDTDFIFEDESRGIPFAFHFRLALALGVHYHYSLPRTEDSQMLIHAPRSKFTS